MFLGVWRCGVGVGWAIGFPWTSCPFPTGSISLRTRRPLRSDPRRLPMKPDILIGWDPGWDPSSHRGVTAPGLDIPRDPLSSPDESRGCIWTARIAPFPLVPSRKGCICWGVSAGCGFVCVCVKERHSWCACFDVDVRTKRAFGRESARQKEVEAS